MSEDFFPNPYAKRKAKKPATPKAEGPPRLSEDDKLICPFCEVEMIERTATQGPLIGNRFWGCPKFPKCRHTYSQDDFKAAMKAKILAEDDD